VDDAAGIMMKELKDEELQEDGKADENLFN